MKALLCTHYGPPEEMELREVPSPSPGKNQVLIAVRACGVNFPDVLMIQDKYQFRPALPFSPGGEIAGVVKALGEDVGADSRQIGAQLRKPPAAEHQLAKDQQRPAVADKLKRMGRAAGVVVAPRVR